MATVVSSTPITNLFSNHFPIISRRTITLPFLFSSKSNPSIPKTKITSNRTRRMPTPIQASQTDTSPLFLQQTIQLLQSSPPTWQSAILSNLLIFLVGSPLLVTGLSLSGIAAAFLLGTLTWRAFSSSGFLLVASYFIIVSSKSHLFYFSSCLFFTLVMCELISDLRVCLFVCLFVVSDLEILMPLVT